MTSSESRTLANRENAKKSTGPRTAEGKAISRRNALRHGMAGEGVVLLSADEAKLAERQVTWAEDFRPRTASEAYLVSLAALHSVKLDRCAAVESAGAVAAAERAAERFGPTRRARIAALEAALRQCDRLGDALRRHGTLDGEYLRKLIDLLGPFGSDDPRHADLVALAFEARPKSAAKSTLPLELLAVCKPKATASKPADPSSETNPSPIDAAEAGRRASREVLAGLIAGHRAERVRERDRLVGELGSGEARELEIAASAIDAGEVGRVARRYESASENGLFRALGKLERLQARAVDALPNEANDRTPGILVPTRRDGDGDGHLEASVPVPIFSSAHHLRYAPAATAPLPNEAKDRVEVQGSVDLPNEPKVSEGGVARGGSAVLPNEANDRDDRDDRAGPAALPNEANDLGGAARAVPTPASSAMTDAAGVGRTPGTRPRIVGKAETRRRKAESRRRKARSRKRKAGTR